MDNLLSEEAPAVEAVASVPDATPTPAAPAGTPSFKDFISDEGGIDANYIARYKEYDPDVDEASLTKMLESNGNDLNRMVKQSLNLNKMLGKDKIPYPGDTATKEEWDSFWVQAGAPGKDGAYKVSDEVKGSIDENTLNGILELGKQANVPQRVMDDIIPALAEAMGKGSEEAVLDAEAAKREAIQALEGSFGRAGSPEFSENINLAQKGLKILAVDNGIEDVAALTAKYGNDPFLLGVFANHAKAGGENGAPIGSTDGALNVVIGLDDKISQAEKVYFASRNQRDLDALMALREKKASF